MLSPEQILQLYTAVTLNENKICRIDNEVIQSAIKNLAAVYDPAQLTFERFYAGIANFCDMAHRRAYMFKYAPIHTSMVQYFMCRISREKEELFRSLTASKVFRICSLGGGPGCDVIGVIAALNYHFGAFQVSVSIVDLMEEWKDNFSSLVTELTRGNYGVILANVANTLLNWNYIGANLLYDLPGSVTTAISEASLITMVKFVSAVNSRYTENMLNNIFKAMRPGTYLLFIDDASGGYNDLVSKVAKENRFQNAWEPLLHEKYTDKNLEIERFGFTSCFTTTVSVQLLLKPFEIRQQKQSKMLAHQQKQHTSHVANITTDPRFATH